MTSASSWSSRALIVLALGHHGCSLNYDADAFAVTDARVAADVDVSALSLTGATPAEIFEGTGCIPSGDVCGDDSRPVPIVVGGSNIAGSAAITVEGAGYAGEEVAATVAAGGDLAALSLAIPVLPDLAAGSTETLTITVTQAGVSDSVEVMVRGLGELRTSIDAPEGTLDAAALAPLYSRIVVDSDLTLTGDTAPRFRATAEIVVDATVDADGGDAANADPGAGGPGGCRGGTREGPGQCTGSGGKAGGANDGGGGGGGSIAGDPGGGSNGGDGGAIAGNPRLTPLIAPGADGSRGHGGGGGGDGAIGGDGGPGGGGGGTVELTSDGRLTMTDAAAITASGGTGAPGTGLGCNLGDHGGGGGGGSGGAILLRALHVVGDDDAAATLLSVDGGAGGSDGSGCNAGGNGAPGRVRVDLPHDEPLPTYAAGIAALYRGPVLAADADPIVTAAELELSVHGGLGATYWISVDSGPPQQVSTGAGRTASAEVTLQPGVNTICALVAEDVGASQPEGMNCLSVAYIPR